jgi:putative transposase
MSRKARIDAPGALHHIIIRGIERNPIFKDSQDYSNFLSRFGNILTETTTSCYAVNVNLNMYQLWQSKNVPLPATYDCNKICAGIGSPPS